MPCVWSVWYHLHPFAMKVGRHGETMGDWGKDAALLLSQTLWRILHATRSFDCTGAISLKSTLIASVWNQQRALEKNASVWWIVIRELVLASSHSQGIYIRLGYRKWLEESPVFFCIAKLFSTLSGQVILLHPCPVLVKHFSFTCCTHLSWAFFLML